MKVEDKRVSRFSTWLSVDTVVVGLLVITTFFVGSILMSIKVKADDDNAVIDDVTAMVPVSCSMTGTIAPGEEHTKNVSGNNYTTDIGVTNIKVICNDYNGFSIYAVGYTGDTIGSGNTDMVGVNTNQTIATGTATSGSTSNWAMKLTKVTNPATGAPITYNPQNLTITTGYDDYHAVPANYTKVASYKNNNGSSSTDKALGSNIQTTYAVFVSSIQPVDTYEGQVKYVLVHPATVAVPTYTVAYNANGGIGSPMTNDTNVPTIEPHTLKANTYTLLNYTFAGWCTVHETVDEGEYQTTCNGTSYPNNGTIPAGTVNGGTLTLYAYWDALDFSVEVTDPNEWQTHIMELLLAAEDAGNVLEGFPEEYKGQIPEEYNILGGMIPFEIGGEGFVLDETEINFDFNQSVFDTPFPDEQVYCITIYSLDDGENLEFRAVEGTTDSNGNLSFTDTANDTNGLLVVLRAQ